MISPRMTALARTAAGVALLVLVGVACQHGRRSPAADAPAASVGTGAHSTSNTLSGDQLDSQRVQRIEELIAGRIPGVRVFRLPNGEMSVQIRGPNGFSGRSEPLFVVDGMPLSSTRSLAGLNPSDVARIEVLKDGAAAMYGVRGANGVILITTKRAQ